MIIIKKSPNNDSQLGNINLNKDFVRTSSNKEFIFYSNKLINSKKFQNSIIDLLTSYEKNDLIRNIGYLIIINLAKLRLIWFKLKKQYQKKYRL
jgi:hypothetical protein